MITTKQIQQQLWIIAGINGAGKTSFANKYLRGKIAIINPDEIAIQENIPPIQAGKIALQMRKTFIKQQNSFAIETTLSGINEINLVKTCKQQGYKINLVYLYLSSTNLANSRVMQRVENFGHDIPYQDIQRRYPKSLKNLSLILQYVDRLFILDNSNQKTQLLCSKANDEIKYTSPNLESKLPSIAIQLKKLVEKI